MFQKDDFFRHWLMTKLINAERAAMYAPDFKSKLQRTRKDLLEEIISGVPRKKSKK